MSNASENVYICRRTAQTVQEPLLGDAVVRFLYSTVRERAPFLFRLAVSRRMNALLGFINFDMPLGATLTGAKKFVERLGIDLHECVRPSLFYDTPRKIFERKIRYWETRPMPEEEGRIVSPADSRAVVGSLDENSMLFIKEKFFRFDELLGRESPWADRFARGGFAVFRLTPEKYHFNHVPVSGKVADIYEVDGAYHACNPRAVVEMVTPYSTNRRTVTVLDTDVPGGAGCGLVAMVEVVALMIGHVVQCYSKRGYDDPVPARQGMVLQRGQPKSLFKPGSSVVVLLFEPDRIQFSPDLVSNQARPGGLFSTVFGYPLTETDITVRSEIGRALAGGVS
ncbi:MAG: phosphatidylserine decarboxylase [Deltaproteobacteria bacterium]|nr:phosphatidylserine decarboxylase [Deltaproteobacteria bacterium]